MKDVVSLTSFSVHLLLVSRKAIDFVSLFAIRTLCYKGLSAVGAYKWIFRVTYVYTHIIYK